MTNAKQNGTKVVSINRGSFKPARRDGWDGKSRRFAVAA